MTLRPVTKDNTPSLDALLARLDEKDREIARLREEVERLGRVIEEAHRMLVPGRTVVRWRE